MSDKSRKIQEEQLEQAIFGRTKKPRQERQTGQTIKAAAALAKAITEAGSKGPDGSRQKMLRSGKLAQALAVQRALLPTLLKKGRGQYKADFKAPGKPTSGSQQLGKGRPTAPTSRPKMNSGGVSFHFKHTFVSKTMRGSKDPNARAAGTASAHQRYLERRGAAEREALRETSSTIGGLQPLSETSSLSTPGNDGPAERAQQGRPLEVGNIGSTFQERHDFWERVERHERQGIERGGRVQCRIILELPHELTGEERLNILRDFAKIFGERQLPYYGIIHRPDDNNDDRNYHAHFAYYDRPSRKSENGTWDFEDPKTRQKKDRDARGALWIKDLRHQYSEIANRHLERAGVEKRYDPRSFADGGVDKIPEQHLGPKLAAMERQGYASREGVHNATVDADQKIRVIIERSQKSRYHVMQQIAPIRAVLDLADGVRDETVAAEAKELRQLAGDYLLNERFLIGHTRRKALHQARKKIELARPYQASKWAETELATIDASIGKKGLDAKTKKRRAGVYRRRQEAEATLAEINQRYEQDWVKLSALDKKAEACKIENTQILSRIDTSKRALDVRLSSTEIRREIARMTDRSLTHAANQPKTTAAHMDTATAPARGKTPFSRPRKDPYRIRIRAVLPGLETALTRIETGKVRPIVSDSGPQNSHNENALPTQAASVANVKGVPEHLPENRSPTQTASPAEKKRFNLTQRRNLALK